MRVVSISMSEEWGCPLEARHPGVPQIPSLETIGPWDCTGGRQPGNLRITCNGEAADLDHRER